MPYKAQIFDGEIPEIFNEYDQLPNQVTIDGSKLKLQTPWGESSTEVGNGYAMVYGKCTESDVGDMKEFIGKLNANILSVGTNTFLDYFVVTETGEIVMPLSEYHTRQ